jgi:hypothetical protein
MILTVAFDNKFDQIDEADCMFKIIVKKKRRIALHQPTAVGVM